MSDFRENYFKARDIIAKELKEKHNLEESYKDDNRLTLDSSTHSIHLTFYTLEGKNLYVTEKGVSPDSRFSLWAYVLQLKDNDLEDAQNTLKEVFKSMKDVQEEEFYLKDTIIKTYQLEIQFLHTHFPKLFI